MASHASYVPHVAARFPAQKYLRLTKDGDVKQFLTAFSPGATSRNGMVQSNLRKHLASTNLRKQASATKLVQPNLCKQLHRTRTSVIGMSDVAGFFGQPSERRCGFPTSNFAA